MTPFHLIADLQHDFDPPLLSGQEPRETATVEEGDQGENAHEEHHINP